MLHVYPCFASKRRWTCRSWEKSYFSPKQWGIACIAQHAKLFIQILTASDFTSNILSTDCGNCGTLTFAVDTYIAFLKAQSKERGWHFLSLLRFWEVMGSQSKHGREETLKHPETSWNILKHPETSWKPIWRQQLAAASYRYFSEAEMTWSETSVDRFAEPRWKQWLRRNCAWFSNRATDQHYGLLEHQKISRV